MADLTPTERAALYRFLAAGFWGPPDAGWLGAASELPELSSHLGGDLAEAYTRVLELSVYPYASVYLDPSGMLDAPWTAFTGGVYRALGLFAQGAPDHLAAHLEALALLLEREADAEHVLELKRAQHGQATLLTGHLLPWLPCFAFAVARADAGFYCALSRLALDAALDHAESVVDTPPTFVFPESEGGPPTFSAGKRGATEARRALQSLLTPARSGLVLSREDIRRVAGALGLGVRFGERSFMLAGLLEAASDQGCSPDALRALSAEAGAQVASYEALSAAHPALAVIWSAWTVRLRRTGAELASYAAALEQEG